MMKTKAELIADTDQLQNDVDAYFQHCEDSKNPRELKNGDVHIRQEYPTIVGLALWLKTHQNTIKRLIDENDDTKPMDSGMEDAQNQARAILVDAKHRIEQAMVQATLNGDAQDRLAAAMLARMGVIGEDKTNINLQISVAGASTNDVDEWSK